MFIFLLLFIAFFGCYYYLSYQVILLNDLNEIFSQTAIKAQADLKGHVELVLEDLAKSYSNILMIIFCAAILSFIWILLLKYNAKIIIWLSVFSLPVILSVGAYYSIKTYINLHKGTGLDGESSVDDLYLTGADVGLIDSVGVGAGNNNNALNQDNQQLPFDRALQTILTAELLSYVRNETLWLVLSIILCLILTASVILLHSLRERVSLSIALIRQASKAINGVKSTLVFPIIPRTFGIAVLIYGIMISLLIISASRPTYNIVGGPRNGKPCNPRTFNKTISLAAAAAAAVIPAAHQQQSNRRQLTSPPNQVSSLSPQFNSTAAIWGSSSSASRGGGGGASSFSLAPSHSQNNNNNLTSSQQPLQNGKVAAYCVANQPLNRQHVWKYHALNLFATLWLINFISGISQTTLAGAFASYYWEFRKPQDVPYFAVSKSFGHVLRYHLDDIVFGSFLIATIRYIKIVIEFIDNRLRRKNQNTQNVARSAACFFRIFF